MKKKTKTSTLALITSCFMIISYTAANFVLQYFTQVEVSPTLTTAWFSFWGAEILAIAGIKITKVIKGE